MNCSLLLYLTTEHVLENLVEIARLHPPR